MFNLQTTSTTMELLPLVCLCILAWSARGDETGPPVNKIVMEGDDVVLPCSFGAMDITNMAFDWKKQNVADDKREVFLYEKGNIYGPKREGQAEQFKGRVFHFPDQLTSGNASIQIKPTKVDDSGTYICYNAATPPTILYTVNLTVDGVLKDRTGENIPGAAKKPSVTILEHTKDRALLECEVLGASPKPNVTWQDSAGNILPAEGPQITERGNRYDIILNTTVTKTDLYRCVATQEEIYHQLNRTIYVHIEGAAKEPSVTILHETKGRTLLQCEVLGASPKPTVTWQDSAGNILPAEGPHVTERENRYDIILQTTVTKTDLYRCVATQEEIKHQLKTTIYVRMEGSSTGWIVAVAVIIPIAVVLLCVVVVLIVVLVKIRRQTGSQEPTSLNLDSIQAQQPLKG